LLCNIQIIYLNIL